MTDFDMSTLEHAAAQLVEETTVRLRGTGRSREGNIAQEFVDERLTDRYLWVKALGWMKYETGRWIRVTDESMIEVTRKFVLVKVQVSAGRAAADADDADGVVGMWAQYLDRSKLNNLVLLARGITERQVEEFDTHVDKMNVNNGVICFRTGALLAHSPEYLFTKTTPVDWNPNATHKDWEQALSALPEDKREYFQDRCGQAITGEMSPDDVLVIQRGGGENGKTTVMYGIRQAIGEYFTLISDRTLLVNPNAHPTELMDLQGARFAVIEETPEARQLNVKRLKDVVGTPEIKARHMKKDSVTFAATHSLFLNTNYKLVVTETDHGTWRRLTLLTWPYRYRKPHEELETEFDRRGDETLRQRVREDRKVHEAALAWLVKGAIAWYARDRKMLPAPASIIDDTNGWRAESDAVWSYVQEHVVFDTAKSTPASDVLKHFNKWLDARYGTTWTAQQFKDRFIGHDIVPMSVACKTVKMSPRVCRAPGLIMPGAITGTTVKAYASVVIVEEDQEDIA